RPRTGSAGTSRPVRPVAHRTASSHRDIVLVDSFRSIGRQLFESYEVKSARTVTFPGAAGFGHTLAPLRRGRRDPCFQAPGDGTIWRTSLLPSGPVAARISRAAPNAAHCVAWGSGAEEFAEMLPALLGADDDASDFVARDPTVAAALRRVP